MIDEILDKLNRLRERDAMFTIFGAKVHRYRLSAPHTEKELADFEAQYGVTLPADYRAFLMRVGGSGAGPYYGLLPLGYHKEALPLLSQSFPHSDEWNQRELSDDEYLSDDLTRGAMRICNTGDGGYELLVVTGAESGMIWADDWYNEWLDRSLALLDA
jgi:hypothetical protein